MQHVAYDHYSGLDYNFSKCAWVCFEHFIKQEIKIQIKINFQEKFRNWNHKENAQILRLTVNIEWITFTNKEMKKKVLQLVHY